jgi:hypothetical protein
MARRRICLSAAASADQSEEMRMRNLSLFIPITKVDETQRLVYGIATAEIEDRAGEICDYASTKPYYEKWSDEIAHSTGGRSLGNLRAMHGPVAAGKVTTISFNDEARQIEICAKVVDDGEWLKVTEGVYTGFSQGGSYERRWTDETGHTRYTAVPNEISLVDLPCLPQARFEMIKVDGTRELRGFESRTEAADRLVEVMYDLEWLKSLSTETLADIPGFAAALDDVRVLVEPLLALLQSVELKRVKAPERASAPKKLHDGARFIESDRPTESFALYKLEKHFDRLSGVLEDVLERVENIERQPLPLPFGGGHRTVEKHDDGAADIRSTAAVETLLSDPDALSILAIRLAQRNGRVPLR